MKTNKILDDQRKNLVSILNMQEKINHMMIQGEDTNVTHSNAMTGFLISHLKGIVVLLKDYEND
jgi:hypothetical protein